MSPTCWLVAADQSVTPLLSRVIIQDYLLLCFSSAGNDVTCYGSADGDRQWLCPITLPDGADPHDTVIIPSPISCGWELLVRRDWGGITPNTFICIMTMHSCLSFSKLEIQKSYCHWLVKLHVCIKELKNLLRVKAQCRLRRVRKVILSVQTLVAGCVGISARCPAPNTIP